MIRKRGTDQVIRKSGKTNRTGWVVRRWPAARRNSPIIRRSGFRTTARPPSVNTRTLHPHAGVDPRGSARTFPTEATDPAAVSHRRRAGAEGSPTTESTHPADPKTADCVRNRKYIFLSSFNGLGLPAGDVGPNSSCICWFIHSLFFIGRGKEKQRNRSREIRRKRKGNYLNLV